MSGNTDPLPGEFALIAEIFAPLATDPGAFNLTDDAAIIPVTPGQDLVLTADMLSAGVHFFADDAPAHIAQKMLRANLSDLAAKGATPHGYLLTVALPRSITLNWLREFADGLRRDQHTYGITLLGGDTTATDGPLTLSVTAIGRVPAGQMLRRSGARPGDGIYVTGSIGDSALGLMIRNGKLSGLSAQHTDYLVERYLLPQPRSVLASHLHGKVSAAIDISDGLAADLGHICHASNLGARVRAGDIPLSDAARACANVPLAQLITGGDDYELLLAIPPKHALELQNICNSLGVPLTHIGEFTVEPGIIFLDGKGAEIDLTTTGYQHF